VATPEGTDSEYLEFFRVDPSRAVRRILLPSVLLLTVGPPLVLFSATMKQMPGHAVFGFIGAALMMCGLLTGFGGIATMILEDRYVAVTEKGLVVHLGRDESFHAWDDLTAIRCDRTHLILEPRAGSPVRVPFASPTLDKIAERLEDWRRKAAWNLAPT
jgi:hypothetical protein